MNSTKKENISVFDKLKYMICSSYAPYSNTNVVSMVATISGNSYFGANIENTSYGLTICAERIAVFNAVINNDKKIEKVYVYCPDFDFILPCGACLQVISEFCENAQIISFNKTGIPKSIELIELLPKPFSGCKFI